MLDMCLAFLDYLFCSITTRVEKIKDCKAIDHGIVASMVDVQLKIISGLKLLYLHDT